MKTLSIDIETRSGADLNTCGVYRYAEDPDFSLLLFGYSVDDEPVQVVDTAHGEAIPAAVLDALADPGVVKYAFNASFERVCLSRFLGLTGKYLHPEGWRCTMVWSATAGLPLSLQAVGDVLGIQRPKMTEGKRLIRKFSCVSKEEAGQDSLFNDSDWELFKEYNRRDVEAETDIRKRLEAIGSEYPGLWEEYAIDQQICDNGPLIDETLVQAAVAMDTKNRLELTSEMKELTGLENPNSVSQLRYWLDCRGVQTDSLDKKAVRGILSGKNGADVERVLVLRQQLSKSSVKKYQTMAECACADHRARGMFQFYGSRTGRWAGRLVQMQNLPQNHLSDLEDARVLVREGNYEAVKLLYGNVSDTLSQLIRTAFIAAPGKRLIVADFSAIEARVIAWLAGESWRQEVFARNGDIYCASAGQMFGVPVEKHGVNGHLRQKGKIAELALGYGGGVGALKNMGAPEMGLREMELPGLVSAWRRSNPRIVKLWREVDEAIQRAIRDPGKEFFPRGLHVTAKGGILRIKLPSGRSICYIHPQNDKDGASYEGLGTTRKWERISSYGPKFVENIVQGIARDLLMNAMQNLKQYRIEMHIHDELVIEAGPELTLEDVCRKMAEVPAWASGLILSADGYETPFYKKD